ncbi:uncharacterized protein LOC143899142 isoform X1 [Temnothorax americanus]|uniref:uncharacterized protein LOC143899142 isoform X1 n=1 Tax=Temnothorax americanus TaxID=1964332 RepID=UPI00406845FD
MSPRRTRAAAAEQSAVSTRSKAQRINNVSQDVAKSAQKVRQSQRKEKSGKSDMEAAKQSAKKESPDAEVTFKKSAKKKTSRRRLYLNKVETEDVDQKVDNEAIRILRDKYCDNVTTVELVRHNFLQLNGSKDLDSEKIPNGKLQQKISAKISPIIVTPKSTPPKLSLTPHRSKKTPKKSPISLGSPKTHSIAIPKLFKSPRKLSLAATGEDTEESLEKPESDSHATKSRKSKKDSPNNSSGSDKSTLISPIEKKKREKSDINLKATVRRFSKSPKIVLKSPKSKKSKSRKLKLLTLSRVKKSPSKTSPSSPGTSSNLNTSSPRIRIKKSPLSKGKNLSSVKRRLLNSKLTNTLTPSQIKDVLAEPIVLLEKLSPENLKQENIVASKTRSDTFIKVRSPSIRGGSSSEVLTPIKKASVSMSPKRNSSSKLRNSSMEKSRSSNTNRVSPRIKYNTSIPLMSSTPQEGKVTLMDTSLVSDTSVASVNNTSLNTKLRHRSQSNAQLSNTMDKNTDIKNVSRPSLFDKEINDTSQSLLSNVTRRNATYDKDNTMEKKQESNKDNTYELEQPQTISLRQMIKKRTSTEANLSSKDNAKKAKVRFAVGTSGGGSARKSVNKLNGSRSSISHDVDPRNRSNIMNSVSKSKKVETPKLTQNSLFSPFKRSSPRNHGGTPRAQLSRVQVTPKTFASTEKKSEKKSSTKKVPNFSRIHEQMFAKSESLVDAKKRLEARHGRHLAFKLVSTKTAVKSLKADVETEEKKLLPTDTRDGIHNRFGFKLKKPEATNIMLKKQPGFSRQKQQHETRMMLKGVRTNRRFELQMKARNVKS